MNDRSRRRGGAPTRTPFGAVDGNALAARTSPFRRASKNDKAPLPSPRTRSLPLRTHSTSRHDSFGTGFGSPMDAETRSATASDDGNDADFGHQESFHDWLTDVGLRAPLDPNRGGTLVSARQREELQRVWADAAETETLRRLVENLKDGELEMARHEQMVHEGWCAEFERATETQWRDRVEQASAAEENARRELVERTRLVDEAQGTAVEERRAAQSANAMTNELRSELLKAKAEAGQQTIRTQKLYQELRRVHDDLSTTKKELTSVRALKEEAERTARSLQNGFVAEKQAYERVRDESSAAERNRNAHALEVARREIRVLRAAASAVESKLRDTAKDGFDGKNALKQALALREAEAERGRRGANEARAALATAEEKVVLLEGKLRELRSAAETKIHDLKRSLQSTKAHATAAETAEAVAEEAAAKMKQRATAAVAAAEAKALEIKKRAEAAVRAARKETAAAQAAAQAAQSDNLNTIKKLPADDTLRLALERVTKAHAVAVTRYETAEREREALKTELRDTKKMNEKESIGNKYPQSAVTPRTRSRTSLRLEHGAPVAADSPQDQRSPETELRRRAVAMGLRASPFASKRKR